VLGTIAAIAGTIPACGAAAMLGELYPHADNSSVSNNTETVFITFLRSGSFLTECLAKDKPASVRPVSFFCKENVYPIFKHRAVGMDEGRKRVIGHRRDSGRQSHHVADDLFGGPQGSPRTDKMIAAAVQWAELIMRKVDSVYSDEQTKECRSESHRIRAANKTAKGEAPTHQTLRKLNKAPGVCTALHST
jgi:hypothetical protein